MAVGEAVLPETACTPRHQKGTLLSQPEEPRRGDAEVAAAAAVGVQGRRDDGGGERSRVQIFC